MVEQTSSQLMMVCVELPLSWRVSLDFDHMSGTDGLFWSWKEVLRVCFASQGKEISECRL